MLRLSVRTIRRWIDQGRVPAVRTHPGPGGRLLLRRADVLGAVGLSDPAPEPAPVATPRRRRRTARASA